MKKPVPGRRWRQVGRTSWDRAQVTSGAEVRREECRRRIRGEFLTGQLSQRAACREYSPVSVAAGKMFHWEVLYHPQDVTLVLNDITDVVPEPTALPLFAATFLALTMRRGTTRVLKTTRH